MKLSAEDILNIPINEPGVLFNANTIKTEYTKLAKIWHPDYNNHPKSNDVMTHINILYQKGIELLRTGNWIQPGFISISGKNGKKYEIRFRINHNFELGTMYISDKVVVYLIFDIYEDLFENALKVIKNFKYANDKMKTEVSRYLPKIIDTFETKDNKLGMVIEKTSDLFLLKDVLNCYAGKIPERHVAWIQSTLHNLACYLDYINLSHNAISLDTYFISPLYHSGALLGGWWYAVPQGSNLISVPLKTYSIMPIKIKNNKQGSNLTDSELIRAVGRELLGDRIGTKLSGMNVAPQPMINWLRNATSDNALNNYKKWKEVLLKSFGTPKFVEMNLTADMLYSKIIKFN